MIDVSGFTRGGEVDEMDPLFARGKSPVLGQDVEVRTSGALPAEFPATGPGSPGAGPRAPTPPTPGKPPGAFPELNLPEFPELPPEPQFPGFPGGDLTAPRAPVSWLDLANRLFQQGSSVAGDVKRLADVGDLGSKGLPPWMTPGEATTFNLTGTLDQPWWSANPDLFNVTGPEQGVVLDPSNYHVLGDTHLSTGLPGDEAASGGPGVLSYAGPAVQAAGGIAGLALADPHDIPAMFTSGLQVVGGGAGLASQLLDFAPLEGVSPALALPAAVVAFGRILDTMTRPDNPVWPSGWYPVPGDQMQAVDPSTGRILQYKGNGVFAWSDQTLQGKPVTAEQLTQWQIYPTGQLAAASGYGDVSAAILNAQAQAAMESGAAGSPAAIPVVPEEVAAQRGTTAPLTTLGTTLASQGSARGDYTPDPLTQVRQQLGPQTAQAVQTLRPVETSRGGDYGDVLANQPAPSVVPSTAPATGNWFTDTYGIGDR